MHVNFNIANHGAVHIQDFVDYVRAGVEDAGLPLAISDGMQPDAVNVLLDSFEDPAFTTTVERAKTAHPTMPLVLIATEVMHDGVCNSANWSAAAGADASTYSNTAMWSRRTAGFRRIARVADVVLCPSEPGSVPPLVLDHR